MRSFIKRLASRSGFFAIIDKIAFWITRIFFGSIWKIELALRGVKPFFNFSVVIYGRPIIALAAGSEVELEEEVILMNDSRFCLSASLYAPCKIQTLSMSSKIHIRKGVSLNGTSIVCRSSEIIIGARTMIGPNVMITDSPFHNMWPLDARNIDPGVDIDSPVKIGSDVWICSQVIILPGSSIGSGSVIAAGSVVRGVIPCNCLAAGVPAKVIRYLDKPVI